MVLEPNFGTGRNRPVADSKQATDMSNEESGLPPLVLPFGSMVAGSGGIAGAASVNPAPPHGDTVRIEERFLSIRKALGKANAGVRCREHLPSTCKPLLHPRLDDLGPHYLKNMPSRCALGGFSLVVKARRRQN